MCGWLDVPLTSGGRTPEPASLQLYGIRVDPVCARNKIWQMGWIETGSARTISDRSW